MTSTSTAAHELSCDLPEIAELPHFKFWFASAYHLIRDLTWAQLGNLGLGVKISKSEISRFEMFGRDLFDGRSLRIQGIDVRGWPAIGVRYLRDLPLTDGGRTFQMSRTSWKSKDHERRHVGSR